MKIVTEKKAIIIGQEAPPPISFGVLPGGVAMFVEHDGVKHTILMNLGEACGLGVALIQVSGQSEQMQAPNLVAPGLTPQPPRGAE